MLNCKFLLILSFFPHLIDSLTCPDDRALTFFNGSCIHVEKIETLRKERQPMTDQCEKFNQYPDTWHLPRLDSKKKLDALNEVFQKIFNATNRIVFRIGLMRDDATRTEGRDLAQWQNPAKWRWSSDNSTLKTSFPDGSPPWLGTEPNNYRFDPDTPQKCVISFYDRSTGFGWDDMRCDFTPQDAMYLGGHDLYLICESANDNDDDEDFYEVDDGDQPRSVVSTQPKEKFEAVPIVACNGCGWKNFMTGLIVGVLLICTAIAVIGYVKWRLHGFPLLLIGKRGDSMVDLTMADQNDYARRN